MPNKVQHQGVISEWLGCTQYHKLTQLSGEHKWQLRCNLEKTTDPTRYMKRKKDSLFTMSVIVDMMATEWRHTNNHRITAKVKAICL